MRALMVDGQPIWRELVAQQLAELSPGMEIRYAEDGETGREQCLGWRPDIVIFEVLLASLSGLLMAKAIEQACVGSKLVVLSAELDAATLAGLQRLYLSGFIDKSTCTLEELRAALQRILGGERYFSATVQQAMEQLRTDPVSHGKILTRREQQVLIFVGGGRTDAQIGNLLGLSEQSVQTMVRNLRQKLSLRSRTEVIHYALNRGFWKAPFEQLGLAGRYHDVH